MIEEMVDQGDIFLLIVSGNSMQPFLRSQRDKVVFASLNGHTLRRGDILLSQRTNGAYVMHRLHRISQDGICTFIGDRHYNTEVGISRF